MVQNLSIHALLRMLADDILLIAGKGHEQTQEINGEFLPFSDFAIVDQLQSGKN